MTSAGGAGRLHQPQVPQRAWQLRAFPQALMLALQVMTSAGPTA